MARRFATRIGVIRANRFARIDSQKNPIFMTCERFARISSNLRFEMFSPPKARFAKKGFSSGTLKRFSRIMRFARRESGHLRFVHATLRGHSPRVFQSESSERNEASTEGTRVGARRGFLIMEGGSTLSRREAGFLRRGGRFLRRGGGS